jgi:hypothetical protein
VQRLAEIACDGAAEPVGVLHHERTVEAEPARHLGDLLGCRVLADDSRDGTAGNGIDHAEDRHGGDENDRQQLHETAADEADHARPPSIVSPR